MTDDDATSRAPEASWRGLALAVLGYNVLFTVGLFVLRRDSFASHLWTDLIWTVTSLAATLRCFAAAREAPTRRARVSWCWWGAGSGLWFLGMLYWSWLHLVLGRPAPVGAPSDFGFILAPLCFVPAVWFMRHHEARPGAPLVLATELGMAACLLFILVGGVFYQPIVGFEGDPVVLQGALARLVTYTFALLFAVIALSPQQARVPSLVALLLLLGLACLAGIYIVFAYTLLVGSYQVGRGFDALWCFAFSLILLAAERSRRVHGQALDHSASGSLDWVWLVLFLTLCAGLTVYWDAVREQTRILVIGVAGLVLFAGLRWALLLRLAVRASGRLADEVRAREEFISIASHELRTPLTSMKLQIELIERHAARSPDGRLDVEQVRPHVRGALRGAGRLAGLIDVLLDVSRLEDQGLRLNLEAVSLSDILAELVERIRPELEDVGSPLRVSLAPEVIGYWDAVRLEQVASNLVTNAMKFGAGKPITLTLTATPDEAVLEVTDGGIGIPLADRARIFGRFERAVSVKSYGGLGLGLYVCSEIVRSLGGSISAGGEPGRGAVFTVRLPRRLEAIPADETAAVPERVTT